VTTVCAKLFDIVKPDIAFFGQKDAQQAVVIKRMVSDLNLPLTIEVRATERESDGLALSSRNQYLSADERKDAPLLYKALKECEKAAFAGVTDAQKLIEVMKNVIGGSAAITIDYVQIVDAETLVDVAVIAEKALVAVAVRCGKTRLIDNLLIDLNNRPADV
jgi:pantoate--beta-alanine ligase